MEPGNWIALGATAIAAASLVVTIGFSRVAARRAQEIADRYQPGWRLRAGAERNVVLLVNESPEVAYRVHVDVAPWFVTSGTTDVAEVSPYSSVLLYLDTDTDGSPQDSITVTWHRRADGTDERRTWTYPLRWLYHQPE